MSFSRFGPALLVSAALLGGCTSGLSAWNDTDGSPDGDPETGDIGTPLDSEDHDGNNVAPSADAGADVTVEVGTVVDLDGRGSSDADGDELSFVWTLTSAPSGSSAEIEDPDRARATLVPDVPGSYVATLGVTDGILAAADEVVIEAFSPNGAPRADAGPDQTVSTGATVQLDGSNSRDPDGDVLNFTWTMTTRPGGSHAVLDAPTSPLPRFTADVDGQYRVELVVDDGTTSSPADSLTVTAQTSDDGDCLSCAAEVERRMRTNWTAGELASGPGLVMIPLAVLLWQRKRKT